MAPQRMMGRAVTGPPYLMNVRFSRKLAIIHRERHVGAPVTIHVADRAGHRYLCCRKNVLAERGRREIWTKSGYHVQPRKTSGGAAEQPHFIARRIEHALPGRELLRRGNESKIRAASGTWTAIRTLISSSIAIGAARVAMLKYAFNGHCDAHVG
jgi:hypothetical protein